MQIWFNKKMTKNYHPISICKNKILILLSVLCNKLFHPFSASLYLYLLHDDMDKELVTWPLICIAGIGSNEAIFVPNDIDVLAGL